MCLQQDTYDAPQDMFHFIHLCVHRVNNVLPAPTRRKQLRPAQSSHAPILSYYCAMLNVSQLAPVIPGVDFMNGPTLAVFFETDCPTCQMTVPYLNRLANS